MKKFTYLLLGLLITTSVFASDGCAIKLENYTLDTMSINVSPRTGNILVNNIPIEKSINMPGKTSMTLQTTTQNNVTAGFFTLVDTRYPNNNVDCRIAYYGQSTGFEYGGLQVDANDCNIPFPQIVNTTLPCSGEVIIGLTDKAKIT